MKVKVILILSSLTLVLALPFEDGSRETSEDGWFVPQLDGSLKWMTKEEAESEEHKFSMKRSSGDINVEFYLYTQESPDYPQEIFIGNVETFSTLNFNSQNPTRIIIHGWQKDYTSEMNVEIRNALLDKIECNVISVDWSDKSYNLNYIASKNSVPKVGEKVAELIDFLVYEGNMSLDGLHVIGHSLGAHVAGFAGKNTAAGLLHTIIGLDPAWPLYNLAGCSKRLCKTDAMYVESIHTNGGLLGFLNPIGHADFYAGGGVLQPGCGVDIGGVCSHLRAYSYYAESIRENQFASKKCLRWSSAILKLCKGEMSSAIKLGSPYNYKEARGYYFTPVRSTAPFGME